MTGLGALRLMNNRVSFKRLPVLVGGKRGEAELHLSDVPCTRIVDLDAETMVRFPTKTPSEMRQCFVPSGTDVVEGDSLVDEDGNEMAVKEASDYGLGTRLLLINVRS